MLFPINPSFSYLILIARSTETCFIGGHFRVGAPTSFRTHLMLCCNRGMSGWRYGTHLTLLHFSCLERWEQERFSKFGLWIKSKIRRREGEWILPRPGGHKLSAKQHPATVGERLGSMDLFEVLVHVMVNLVLLELNRSGLICMEVGWGGGRAAELLVTPTSVCVCGRESWPSVVGYYKCLTSPFSPFALSAHPETLFQWGPIVSRALYVQENTFSVLAEGQWSNRFSQC